MERIKVAVVQTRSTEDIANNLARAATLVRAAAADGARLVALPENVAFLRISTPENFGEPLDGPIISYFAALARETGAAILVGSFQEATGEAHRVYNTSVLLGPDGAVVRAYRKIHLFDIDIPGQVSFQESAHVVAGGDVVTADLLGARFGL